ncbi:hypothetical protein DES52_1211 [Deinococcus yavapaiensis KR-236]|uniref:Uncharacterized protein n=1 Tax=Deinococcus yavapaiensis KR-236 TaxID=694435 RepID=A0A318S400_9DEIO|nr:hypothetical protein DES52_1211 [Deinococcus yavapaiensis KR-236]
MLVITPLTRRSTPPGFDFHIHEDGTAPESFLEPPTHAFTLTFQRCAADEVRAFLVTLLEDGPPRVNPLEAAKFC